jgi:hypothetical protein
VEENVSIVGASLTCLRVLIAALNPTMPCRAELLTAMYATLFVSSCLIISMSIEICTLFSYGASVNGLMASMSSISISLSASATW